MRVAGIGLVLVIGWGVLGLWLAFPSYPRTTAGWLVLFIVGVPASLAAEVLIGLWWERRRKLRPLPGRLELPR